jgi:excisionase family DNA binding protein
MSEVMNTREAAAYVSPTTSHRTIVAWIKSGRLRATRYASGRGRFRILKEDLDAALNWNPESLVE